MNEKEYKRSKLYRVNVETYVVAQSKRAAMKQFSEPKATVQSTKVTVTGVNRKHK